jgi:hypothetical protein
MSYTQQGDSPWSNPASSPNSPRKPRKMSNDTFERAFSTAANQAVMFRDSYLSADRVKQWRYYNGQVDTIPRRGRSSVVATEVADTCDAAHAQLLRVFGNPRGLVQFVPSTGSAQTQADIATSYIYHLFFTQNPGWRNLSSFLLDALVADVGIFYHRAEPSEHVEEEFYMGLTEDECDALAKDADVTILSREEDTELLHDVIGNPLAPDDPEPDDEDDTQDGAADAPPMPTPMPMPPGMPPAAGMSLAAALNAGPGSPKPTGLAGGPAPPQPINGAGPPMGMPPMGGPPAPQGMPMSMPAAPPPPVTYSLRLLRRSESVKIKVDTVSPDEFLIDGTCEKVGDCRFMAVYSDRTVGDLTAAGFKWRDVIGHASPMGRSAEQIARQPKMLDTSFSTLSDDPTTWPIRVCEAAVRIDADGDGVPEMYRVIALGNDYSVIERTRISDWPFTIGSPYIVPHSPIGAGLARRVIDLQDQQTSILRQQLDSLYAAVNPRFTAVESSVNLDDATYDAFGRIIRIRQPNAFMPLNVEFVGAQAFPMVDRLDKIREFRTGISPQSAGLDPKALQSSTETGVREIVDARTIRLEAVARTLAETAFAPMFSALLKLAVRNQDKLAQIHTSDGFLQVDPQGFDPNMECVAIVGLGNGTDPERMMALGALKNTQEMIMGKLGPSNPLSGLQEYRNTMSDLLRMTPYREIDRYFKPLPPNIDQIMAQQAQQAQQQAQAGAPGQAGASPQADAAKAQATMMKTQADIQHQQAKQAADQQAAQQQMQLQAAQHAQDMQFQQWKAQKEMELEKLKALMQIELQRMKIQADTAVDMHELQAETALRAVSIRQGTTRSANIENPDDAH